MTRLDAAALREELARDLAFWKEAGFMSFAWTERWTRRVRHLARVTRIPRAEVEADLERDAEALLAEGEVAR